MKIINIWYIWYIYIPYLFAFSICVARGICIDVHVLHSCMYHTLLHIDTYARAHTAACWNESVPQWCSGILLRTYHACTDSSIQPRCVNPDDQSFEGAVWHHMYIYIYIYTYTIFGNFGGFDNGVYEGIQHLELFFLRVSPPWEKIFTPLSSS